MLQCKQLIPLQELDLKIDAAKKQIDEKKNKIAKMQKQIEEEATLLEKKKALLKNIQLRKRKAESEVTDLSQKLKVNEIKMQSAGLPKNAYTALEKEVDVLKQKIDEQETKILSDMEKIEILEEDTAKGDKVIVGRREHFAQVKQRVTDEILGDKKELELIITERRQNTLKIDSTVLTKYEELRNRKKGQVLFAVDGNSCPKCGMNIPVGTLNSIKGSEDADSCENCGVYLYWNGARE